MRSRVLLAIVVSAGALGARPTVCTADLLAVESFEYGTTPNLYGADGGTGWADQWYKLSTVPTGVASDALSWPGLATKGLSAYTAPYPSSDFTRYSRPLAGYTAPDDVVYVAFLFRPNPGFGVNGGLSFGSWDNGMVIGLCPTGHYGLMTPPNTASSLSSTTMAQGVTTLLVTRIKRDAEEGTTIWSLFVDPTVGAPEPAVPDAALTVPMATLPAAVMLYNDGGFSTDEIRVGTSWSDVLPRFGDVTGDGVIDVTDLVDVILAWGACPAPCPADVNGDGVVDVVDLVAVILNWG